MEGPGEAIMKDIINQLAAKQPLSVEKAKEVLGDITAEKYNPTQVTAFLTAYIMRKITSEELRGFREALLERCIPIDFSDFNTIDLCGTGGDGKNTFNISTLSSLVVAGAGYKVAKHGNYSASSASGSSSVMEYFGVKFTNEEDKLKQMLDKAGMAYLHAPLFHPALKSVGPIRRELGMKTFFNILGPLLNPAMPQNQITGVFDLDTMALYNEVFKASDANYSIVHALDGYDEISLTGDFKIITNTDEQIMSPEQLGLPLLKQEELFGGDTVEEAASIFKNILDGKGTEAQNSAVYANSAMAIKTINPDKSIEACVSEAKKSVLDGNAKTVLENLVKISNQ